MIRLFLIMFLVIGLILIGCSKKDEEIEALQQEAADEDAAALMDSLESGTEPVEAEPSEYTETTAAETETDEIKEEAEPDYAQAEGYVVQLGSYRDYELATYWAEKYQDREYPAFLRQVEIDGITHHRLRVGVYDTYDEAKRVGETIADRYSATYWIDNNR